MIDGTCLCKYYLKLIYLLFNFFLSSDRGCNAGGNLSCSNGGTCTTNGTCICINRYYGESCSCNSYLLLNFFKRFQNTNDEKL
jgi:hypothetical protein